MRAYPEPLTDFILRRNTPKIDSTQEKDMTAFQSISEKLAAWRRYRDAVRELSQMTDRELSDIGICRGDIETIVRRAVMSTVD